MCPTGFTPYDGDVWGGGLTGLYAANLAKCAADCDENNNCNGFEYSQSKQMCKLLSQNTPTEPKYGDYQFCSKGK